MSQVCGGRVTSGAMSVEISQTRFGIACYDIQKLILAALHRGLTSRKQERRDILDLLVRHSEFRHALAGTAVQDPRSAFGAGALVVEHPNRPPQIRTSAAA